LSAAGKQWAERQPLAQIPDQIVPVRSVETDRGPMTDFGTYLTMRNFLAASQVIFQWAHIAEKAGPLDSDWPSSIPLEVWLIGARLPQLYESTYPGKTYTQKRKADQTLYGESLAFVQQALAAMKIVSTEGKPWAAETINNYRTRAIQAGLVQSRKK
jgi:hypothetical protein